MCVAWFVAWVWPSLVTAAVLTTASIATAPAARAVPPAFTGPLADDGGFARGEPTPEARARYQAAADYSAAHAGRAVLVIEGDAVVFEANQNGYDGRKGHALWSGTKVFACTLALAAEAKGKLSFDEKVADTLPAVGAIGTAADIRVRDLLSFTSGLASGAEILTIDFNKASPTVRDSYAWTLDHLGKLTAKGHAPGSRFLYGPAHLALFGAMMQAKLGEDPVTWLEREVLTPIGFTYTGWQRDPTGHPSFAFGVYTTPRAWARFGLLVRDDGVFRGARVLPAGAFGKCFHGSAAMPAYGFNWWLNEPVTAEQMKLVPSALGRLATEGRMILPDGPADLVMAAGYRDNRLYVVPSKNLVVVRFGQGDAAWSDPAFMGALLGIDVRRAPTR